MKEYFFTFLKKNGDNYGDEMIGAVGVTSLNWAVHNSIQNPKDVISICMKLTALFTILAR